MGRVSNASSGGNLRRAEVPRTPRKVVKSNGNLTAASMVGKSARTHYYPIAACVIGVFLVLFGYNQVDPMQPTDGKLFAIAANGEKLDRPILPGDRVKITWDQDWHRLCPLTIHRVITGADNVAKRPGPFDVSPPPTIGKLQDVPGEFIFPFVAPGKATYQSVIEPHCFVDRFYQRQYETPEVRFEVGAIEQKIQEQIRK